MNKTRKMIEVECPYTVMSARQIWEEGIEQGVKLAMKYTESKRKSPIMNKHYKIVKPGTDLEKNTTDNYLRRNERR